MPRWRIFPPTPPNPPTKTGGGLRSEPDRLQQPRCKNSLRPVRWRRRAAHRCRAGESSRRRRRTRLRKPAAASDRNLTDSNSLAAKILCGLSAGDAARLTDAALENLPADAAEPAYEIWRRR